MKLRILQTNAARDGFDHRFVLNCKKSNVFLVAMQKKISIRGAFASQVYTTAGNHSIQNDFSHGSRFPCQKVYIHGCRASSIKVFLHGSRFSYRKVYIHGCRA